MNEFGKRLKMLRERNGKTVAEVAKAIGVPVSTYREWEYGRSVRGEFYLPLSLSFGVSLFELLTGNRPRPSCDLVREIEAVEKQIDEFKKRLIAQMT